MIEEIWFETGGGQKNEEIHPRSTNADTVEWTFDSERQMVGGSHSGLTDLGFDRGDRKSDAFNAAKYRIVGINKQTKFFIGRIFAVLLLY